MEELPVEFSDKALEASTIGVYQQQEIAEAYHRKWGHDTSPRINTCQEVFANLLPEKKTVLDAGCASGRDVQNLLNLGVETVHGIDLSVSLLNFAKEEAPQGIYTIGDIRKLPYTDESFDGINCINVFLHLQPESIRKSLSEFYRVLKPGGLIYLSTVADENFNQRTSTTFGVERTIFRYPESFLEKEIRDAGFDRHHIIRMGGESTDKPGHYVDLFIYKPV
ncbi:MAG: class I SAM-dependent methyltransferase [Candidatus Altiarchaeota archaeon]|nr:class I SAM-dependent methyltransferase [Candidatus Altiarchaeota archaeon]